MRRSACLLLAVWTSTALVPAEEAGSEPARKLEASMGAGIVASPRPYGGVDTELIPVPIGSLRYGRFWIHGVTVGYRVLGGRRGGVDVFLGPRFDGFDSDDSSELRGMDDRDMSADLGFSLSRRREHLEIKVASTWDILDKSDGKEVAFEVGFPFLARGWRLTPAAALVWQGEDFVEYYYGVRPEEALPGRPAYNPDSAVSGRASLTGTRRIASSRWSVVAMVTADRPGEEIRDSPIVDASVTVGGFGGFLYSF